MLSGHLRKCLHVTASPPFPWHPWLETSLWPGGGTAGLLTALAPVDLCLPGRPDTFLCAGKREEMGGAGNGDGGGGVRACQNDPFFIRVVKVEELQRNGRRVTHLVAMVTVAAAKGTPLGVAGWGVGAVSSRLTLCMFTH